MDLSGRFLVDPRAPKPPLDFRALASALAAYQAATLTAKVVAPGPDASEHAPRALARQLVRTADGDR